MTSNKPKVKYYKPPFLKVIQSFLSHSLHFNALSRSIGHEKLEEIASKLQSDQQLIDETSEFIKLLDKTIKKYVNSSLDLKDNTNTGSINTQTLVHSKKSICFNSSNTDINRTGINMPHSSENKNGSTLSTDLSSKHTSLIDITSSTDSEQSKSSDCSKGTDLKPGAIPLNPNPELKIEETSPTFKLPNCMVGTVFNVSIKSQHPTGKAVEVVNMKIPDELGLNFDVKTQVVSGTPKKDGTFEINLQWMFSGEGVKKTGTCKLISNPDPKSLWKVLEPDINLPYHKNHLDKKTINADGFKIIGASRRGRSHEHSALFRDDDFYINHIQESGWSIIIVADGAGSAKYSRKGSEIAVNVAGQHLFEALSSEKGAQITALIDKWESIPNSKNDIYNDFYYLFHEMSVKTIKAIEKESEDSNAVYKDYSTTLLVSTIKKKGDSTFIASFWIGDGVISAYGPTGNVKLMGNPDGGEYAGQTRFLDHNTINDKDYAKRVGIGLFSHIKAVILATDGVSDPYFETDIGLADPVKWDALWNDIEGSLSGDNSEEKILDWLHFFRPGHHDDRTIAILL